MTIHSVLTSIDGSTRVKFTGIALGQLVAYCEMDIDQTQAHQPHQPHCCVASYAHHNYILCATCPHRPVQELVDDDYTTTTKGW